MAVATKLQKVRGGLAAMADATPPDRDRYVDFLRAFSIGVVVFGHWLMAIVFQGPNGLTGANALDVIPGIWILTWVLQVMPLFFFVGGFSNRGSWKSAQRDGKSYGEFIQARIERLMRPTIVFITVWVAVALAIQVAAPQLMTSLGVAMELIAKPLWFLAVYVLVTALAPVMVRLHDRYGSKALAGMAAGAVLTDVARIGFRLEAVGYLNFAFVWLFAHQLGFFYSDGSLLRRGRRFAAGMAVSGLGLLTALVGSGIYAENMVGSASAKASNNSPPSICLMALTLWLVGAALWLREPVSRWLAGRGVWEAVVAANSVIMSVFLWHLTALLVAVVVLFPLGFPQPAGGTASWWAWRPAWIFVLLAFLVPFVAAFSRFERPGPKKTQRRALPTARTMTGVCFLVMGLSGLAQYGFRITGDTGDSIALVPVASAVLAIAGHRLSLPRPGGAR